jgi:PAS domain S-box-containing protein
VVTRDERRTDYSAVLSVSAVTGQSPVATIIYDADGRPFYANAAFRKLWGLTTEEYAPGYTLWTDGQFARRGLLDAFRGAFAGDPISVDPFPYDMGVVLGRSGRTRWVQGLIYPLRDDDQRITHVVALLEDVTEQVALEEATRGREERARILQKLSKQLAQAVTRLEVGEVLARQGTRALGGVYGCVALAEGGDAEVFGWAGFPDAHRSRWQRIPLSFTCPLTDSVRSGEPVWAVSPEDLARRWPAFESELDLPAAQCWGVAPLSVPTPAGDQRVLGGFCVVYESAPEELSDSQRLAREVAELGARALERAHLYELTEQARLEAVSARREAEEAQYRAEQANRAKTDFLATMSHELRTPLNAIAGYTELLEMGVQGTINEAQRESLARIRRSQEHLLGLINSILNLAKIESGRVDYQLAATPASELLAQIEPFVRPLIVEKSLRYECAACAERLVVHADAEKVVQILLNLVSNAIKFTSSGGVVAIDAAAEGARVALTVRDTGIGIPEEKLSVIFDRFVQLDTRFTRSAGGTGLGLAISRDLARAMGGDLVAASVEGEGSAFTLLLPAAT